LEGERAVTKRSDRFRRLFPLPYVAIVVLLIVLILVTPNLVSSEAGGLCSDAQLQIDWSQTPHTNLTHFYVRGFCTVRYASIVLGLGTNASASGGFSPPSSSASFNFTNVSTWNFTIVAIASTPLDPVALNISAVYVDTNGNSVTFVGMYAVEVSNGVLYYESYIPSPGGIRSAPVSSLPLTLPLTVGP
jgi:hypothetical protein